MNKQTSLSVHQKVLPAHKIKTHEMKQFLFSTWMN